MKKEKKLPFKKKKASRPRESLNSQHESQVLNEIPQNSPRFSLYLYFPPFLSLKFTI